MIFCLICLFFIVFFSFILNINFSCSQTERLRTMVFNDTFNNISAISWWSVLLVEETINLPQVTVQLYHKMLYQVYLTMSGFELTMLVVIGTDCIGSCKSNYHMITTMKAPQQTKIKVIKCLQQYMYIFDKHRQARVK